MVGKKEREMNLKKSSKLTLGNANIIGITLPSNVTGLKNLISGSFMKI